jgi:hypothetical protein
MNRPWIVCIHMPKYITLAFSVLNILYRKSKKRAKSMTVELCFGKIKLMNRN